MTLEEAQTVATIVGHADGGCSVCVGSLVARLQKAFPEFIWTEEGEKTEYFHYDGTPATEADDDFSEKYIGVVVAKAA